MYAYVLTKPLPGVQEPSSCTLGEYNSFRVLCSSVFSMKFFFIRLHLSIGVLA